MPPSFNEADVSDKPPLIRGLRLLSQNQIDGIRANYQQELETLLSVEHAVESVMSELSREGILDKTLVVYTSDNGFMHGEHRIPNAKMFSTSRRFAFRSWSGDQACLTASTCWFPDTLLLEGPGRSVARMEFTGVRTPRYKYVEWSPNFGGGRELYDLAADPYELQNRQGTPAYASIERMLSTQLHELEACACVKCRPTVSLSLAASCAGKQGALLSVRGADLALVSGVDFVRNGTRFSMRHEKPFSTRVGKAGRVRAQVTLVDGRRASRETVVRRCS